MPDLWHVSGQSTESSENSQPWQSGLMTYVDNAPGYKQYNAWYLPPYTDTDYTMHDYLAVKMNIDGQPYYGWIKVYFDALTCSLQITDQYLHPTPNEHIILP